MKQPNLLLPLSQRSRTLALALALAVFAGSTVLTLTQAPWSDPYSSPQGWDWFFKPRIPPEKLTRIGAHLRAVWAAADNRHVWAAGDFRMLLHSHDGGATWNQIPVERIPVDQTPVQQPPVTAQQQAPPPKAPESPKPSVTASPQSVAIGSTARLQVTTQYFLIEKPNATSSDPGSVYVRGVEPGKSPGDLIITVEISPKTTPGVFTIRVDGLRLPQKTAYPLTFEIRVTPPPAKAAANHSGFWQVPQVYAAEVQPPEVKPPVEKPAEKKDEIDSIEYVEFSTEDKGSIYLRSGARYVTADGGKTWTSSPHPASANGSCMERKPGADDPRALDVCWGPASLSGYLKNTALQLPQPQGQWQTLFKLYPATVWIAGESGAMQVAAADSAWKPLTTGTKLRINALFFQADGMRGWAVGSSGAIFSTADGGQTWTSKTATDKQYERSYSASLAPWYLVVLFLSGATAAIALLSPRPPPAPVAVVEAVGASDRPLESDTDPDPLQFGPIARGIAYFIRNRRTSPPLNLAITGAWGTGKTSLMRLLRSELLKHGFCPVWFNAWHHQNETYLLPSLLETIRQEAVPALWQRGGVAFKLRLMQARSHWWLAVLPLCLIGGVAYEIGPTNVPDSDIASWIKLLPPRSLALGSLVTLMAFIYKWLSAFGVKPAALLSSSGGGARVADLEKQTSFRFRFAKEFREVTRALGPRQLVIFIDDLDRCRPDNTLEVLESVNFLSSSGECFVVMGMAKDVVREYVSASLKGTARALEESGSVKPGLTERRLAEEYLQKLINIEVPVPAADPEEMKKLVSSLKSGTLGLNDTSSMQSVLGGIAAILFPLVLAMGLVIGGMHLGSWVSIKNPDNPDKQESGKAAPPTEQTNVAPSNVAPPAARSAEGPEAPTVEGLTFPSLSYRLWPTLLVIAGIGWAAYRIATWRPDLEPDDSDKFTQALEDVLPMLLESNGTPRAVKRFVNRVRFMAMRQRQSVRDDRPLWQRILEPHETPATSDKAVPEDILVILAALHQSQDYSPTFNLDSEMLSRRPTLSQYDPAALKNARARYLALASGLRAN